MADRNTNPVTRFLTGNRNSRKRAIDAMCAQCVGCTSALQGRNFKDHLEDGYMTAIGTCQITSCPLWGFRPYQQRQEAA